MQTLPYGASRGFDLIAEMENIGMTVTDVTCPEISPTGVLTGKMHGFLIFEFQTEVKLSYTRTNSMPYGFEQAYKIPDLVILALEDLTSFKYSKRENSIAAIATTTATASALKYNYSNVLAEMRKGEESQSPFRSFKKIFIDQPYNRELFGPFNVSSENNVQRILEGPEMLLKTNSINHEGQVDEDEGPAGFNTAMCRQEKRGRPRFHAV